MLLRNVTPLGMRAKSGEDVHDAGVRVEYFEGKGNDARFVSFYQRH
ncbi:MAG: hypothetical protein R2744_03880 [Bacteroidales bacterium]